MSAGSDARELESMSADYVATALRAVAGPLPIIGPLLSELLGVLIPNQRMDRIAKFAEDLESRLCTLEAAEVIIDRLKNEDFTNLLEESIRQAATSLSDDRRQYIAALIVNGLSTEKIEYSESRHLLRTLNELSDVEIVWLHYYQKPFLDRDEEFRERHKNVLAHTLVTDGSSQNERDKAALQDSYKEHLCRLGLLQRRYRVDMQSKLPKFDRRGIQEVQGYALTSLGSLLLRQIGLGVP